MSTAIKQTAVQTNIPVRRPKKNFKSNIAERQTALATTYQQDPKQAWITDVACTGTHSENIQDTLHTEVTVAGVDIAIGVHKAVGGDGDAPVPGELLSAALAGCLDSTIRLIADRLNINLMRLAVVASAEVDVRGTLKLNPNVPVEFQKMHLSVDLEAAADTNPAMLNALVQAAESSCVVLQTLRQPNEISTQFNLACA
jgi:uncharacterized OsmC-like protein